MDEVFFKSVLPAQDPFAVEDTSLALPPEENITSSSKVKYNDRSFRVKQQVQLTLARRGRRTTPNGSIHLHKSPLPRDGLSQNMKVNGLGFSDQSLSRDHVQRPSRRVEVSPAPTRALPLIRPAYGTHCQGTYTTYTIPGPRQPSRIGTLLEGSCGTDPAFRYAFSEVTAPPRASHRHAVCGRSGTQTGGTTRPLLFTDGPVKHSTPGGSPRPETSAGGRQCSAVAGQRQGGLAWLSQLRREMDVPREGRRESDAPSLVSMEVDMAPRRREAEPPVQQAHVKEVTAVRSEVKAPELTLERAVNLLTQDNEDTLTSACSFIQNQCVDSADAKKMVFYLHGIPKLLELLQSDVEEVQCAAAGALRNVLFQSDQNKMEVKEKQGVSVILRVLKGCRDLETRRQLTGVLWNLSSHDLLKEHLSRQALPVLASSVLVPCSGISEGENPKDELLADADTFHNATGCLRNLSSAGPDGRKAMRECERLIDCLVYYIRGTIADYKPDDKATENCVCILHNLSYQIEAELPHKYVSDVYESRQNLAPKDKTPGCFTSRSAKLTEEMERHCPLLEEKANPCGVEWLWSAITVRMYLSLLARSVKHCTQEAAIGALQNITAGTGRVTEAIAHTVVLRENGLQQVRKMLQEGESDVKRMAVSLLRNISRYRELHAEIVKQVLPEVVGMLPNSDTPAELPTEVTVSLVHVLINLSQNHTQQVKAVFNHGALPKIINISTKDTGYGPSRAGQAACVLLHTMWNHSDLHGAYKKAGYRKADFINGRTTKAVSSSRD